MAHAIRRGDGVLGRKITLNSQPYTVVGVMPPGTRHQGNKYHSVSYGDDVDLWSPFTFEGNRAQCGSHYIEGIGRLKVGVTPEQAQSELNSLMVRIAREYGNTSTNWKVLVNPLYLEVVGSSRRILLVLLGAVGMVLLIGAPTQPIFCLPGLQHDNGRSRCDWP